ncbi:helix-turn-helix domain-containing protein [Streptomyces lasalocidi]
MIGELRALKDAHRLSFQELGRLTHFSRASWERWLNGKRPVTGRRWRV